MRLLLVPKLDPMGDDGISYVVGEVGLLESNLEIIRERRVASSAAVSIFSLPGIPTWLSTGMKFD